MPNAGLNIVFFGEDAFSDVVLKSLIASNHRVSLVVTPYYDSLAYKKLEITCGRFSIPLLRSKSINTESVYATVSRYNPDICIISHFEKLIKEPLLSLPRMGFINLHPSLLPNYRGMAPQHWPIINGEQEAGVSVHYVDEGADTGDIIVQHRFSLQPDMYVSDLQRIWLGYYRTIMPEAIDSILSGRPAVEQRNLPGLYYGKLKPEDCVIRKDGSVTQAYNLIRGVSLPYYGAAYGSMTIYRAHVLKAEDMPDTTKPILEFYDGSLIVDMYKTNN